jgi:hypothetical protein
VSVRLDGPAAVTETCPTWRFLMLKGPDGINAATERNRKTEAPPVWLHLRTITLWLSWSAAYALVAVMNGLRHVDITHPSFCTSRKGRVVGHLYAVDWWRGVRSPQTI